MLVRLKSLVDPRKYLFRFAVWIQAGPLGTTMFLGASECRHQDLRWIGGH
jgi:hypothetical protein